MKRASAGLAATLATLALYAPAVAGLRIFFDRDVNNYWRPQVEWALRTLAAGQSIAWNPDLSFGIPMLSDPSFQFFYPPTWVLLLLSPSWAYTFLVVSHSFWGGLGVGRVLHRRGFAEGAAVGAMVLVCAGPFVSMANLWHHFCGAAWIPWVIIGAGRALETGGSWRPLALAFGAQALAGSAESLMMSVAAVAFLNLGSRIPVRSAARVGLALVLGGMLGLVQWIPTLQNYRESARRGFSPREKLSWSVSPKSLVELVVPGRPAARVVTQENATIPPDSFDLRFITQQYLGSSALILVLAGGWVERRVLALLVLTLLVSIGSHWGVAISPLLSALLPFRYPAKLLALVAVLWAFLAGVGATRFLRLSPATSKRAPMVEWGLVIAAFMWPVVSSDPGERALRAAAFALMAIVIVAQRGPFLRLTLPLLILCDLLPQSQTINRMSVPEVGMYRPPIVEAILRVAPRPRIFVAHPGELWMQGDLNAQGRGSIEDFALAMAETLFPPHGMRYGIGYGYHVDFTGLGSSQSREFEDAARKVFQPNLPGFLDMGAITAVVSSGNTLPLGPRPGAEAFSGRLSVPVRLDVWNRSPRVGVPSRGIAVASIEEGLARVAGPDFRPAEDVLIMSRQALAGELGPGRARLVRDETTRIEIEVEMERTGYLVLRDSWRGGWTARVNGQATMIERADFLFRAVRVVSGKSRVVFEYETPGLLPGALLTLAALASILAIGKRR